jgi:hypothetical protein
VSQSYSGISEDNKNILSLPETEPRLLGRVVRSSVKDRLDNPILEIYEEFRTCFPCLKDRFCGSPFDAVSFGDCTVLSSMMVVSHKLERVSDGKRWHFLRI